MTVTERGTKKSPVTEPERAGRPSLEAALGLSGWRLVHLEGEVLRQSRFRPVFRYRVEYAAESGSRTLERILIGKADYRHGGMATFAFMRRLREAGFGGDPDTRIPEPVAYLEDLALLVQSEASGRCLYEWLGDADSDDSGPPATAGQWLGRLHATRLPTADGALPEDFEEQKLTGYCAQLTQALPAHGDRFSACTAHALALLGSLPAEVRVPTHGDYQPKNIYVDGPSVTVIDWDRAALAHPARDVGHFVGQCLTMAAAKRGGFEPGRRWNEAFLEGYAKTAPAGWETGMAPYVARTILEVLYYKLVVKPVRDASFVPLWLDELKAVLGD